MVRDAVNWEEMEPSPGNYVAFPSAFQERLAFYKENDIGLIFGLWCDNPRAYPNTPDDPHHSVMLRHTDAMRSQWQDC